MKWRGINVFCSLPFVCDLLQQFILGEKGVKKLKEKVYGEKGG